MSSKENKETVAIQSEEPAKSSNMWQRFRAWMVQMDNRQQVDKYLPEPDETAHACVHCGAEYTGRLCPQCGMPARWNRFTWKLLILNFLDIWGLGNRPMFRTIRDLFWRPGYMMRDYLGGHHLSYFPPFKMLAVLTVVMIFLGYVLNVQFAQSELMSDVIERALIRPHASEIAHASAIDYFKQFELFMNDHILYRILLQNVMVVVAVWFVFRRKGQLNLVETAFSQIYINCQFLIIGTVLMLLMWCFSFGSFSPDVPLDARHYSLGGQFPYALPEGIGSLIVIAIVLAYDFHQLYGLKWWATIWRTLAVTLVVIGIYMVLLTLMILMFINAEGTLLTLEMMAIMVYVGIYLPGKYIYGNKAMVPKSVYRTSLCSLGMVVMMYPILISAGANGFNMILASVFSILIMLAMSGMSMLMVSLYKKFHKAWLSFLVFGLMLPVAVCLTLLLWQFM